MPPFRGLSEKLGRATLTELRRERTLPRLSAGAADKRGCLTMPLYSEKDLTRVRHVFEITCAELVTARGAQSQESISKDQVSRCIEALLDALIELEVVEETMRIEGNFVLAPEDIDHLRPTEGAGKKPDASC
jgi:hypothetical protein